MLSYACDVGENCGCTPLSGCCQIPAKKEKETVKEMTEPNYFLFSGGEVHTKVPQNQSNTIICTDYTMNGFMAVCETNQILRKRWGVVNLIYPYFPYARQDRWMDEVEDEPFSLEIFCELLNSQKFDSVTMYDPHSDVAPALVKNSIVVPQWKIARKVIDYCFLQNCLIVSPDAGSYKKVSKLINDDSRICIGVKHRNKEGKITHTDVYSNTSIKDQLCLIIDDICDGGRTFIELAKTLKEKGAKAVTLYVTHGIFSKGLDPLKEYVDCIYTSNSFPDNVEKYKNDLENYLRIRSIV